MKIQQIPLSNIKPYWRNARDNDKTVESLKQSIQKYGFNQPLVLDTKNVIITGHARYKALTQLKYKVVDCVIADLDEQKAKEYRIADNKVHELTVWNNDDLMIELREIGNNLDMQSYFQNVNLNTWLDSGIGFDMNNYTEEQFKKKEEDMNNKFKNPSEQDRIELTCPHCLEGFELNKNNL